MKSYISIVLLLSCWATSATAKNEYLTELTSEVYQSPGTPRELANKAQTCISQLLKPGTTDAQLIINSDLMAELWSPGMHLDTPSYSRSRRSVAP